MKDADAVFIAIPYTSDRTPAPGAKETIVPVSPLTSDNAFRDLKIAKGEECVLVLDCYGNFEEVGTKFTKKPTTKELKDVIAKMPGKVQTVSKKLDKGLAAANAALGKSDRNGAFKAAVKVLEEGLVGYSASSEAAKIYNSIIDEVRAEISTIKDGDAKEAQKKLGELMSVFSKKAAPGLYTELAAAKKDLGTVSK